MSKRGWGRRSDTARRRSCAEHGRTRRAAFAERMERVGGPASAGEGPHESREELATASKRSREEIATAGKRGWGRRSDTARRRSCAEHGENPARSIRGANGAGRGPRVCGGRGRTSHARNSRQRASGAGAGDRTPRAGAPAPSTGRTPRAAFAKRMERGAARVTRGNRESGKRGWGPGHESREELATASKRSREEIATAGKRGWGPARSIREANGAGGGPALRGGGAARPLQLEMKAPPHAGHRDCCSLPGLAGLTGQRWRGRKSVTSRGA